MALTLDCLSEDILLYIFKYCDINDLCRLKQTCTIFCQLIRSTFHLLVKGTPLVTNEANDTFRSRTLIELDSFEKWRISHNWKIGRYKEKAYLCGNEKFIPWLSLSDDLVWLSRGKFISAYRRHKNKINVHTPQHNICGLSNSDVCRFVYKNNVVLSGQSDGSFWAWSADSKSMLFDCNGFHLSDVNCVDLEGDIFVTGSKDHQAIIWPFRTDATDNFTPLYVVNVGARVLSTLFSKNSEYLAVGTCGIDAAPLFIYNSERCVLVHELGRCFQRGSGILDMKWDNPNCLYTCGYDSQIRRWDMRVGNLVQCWDDPFQSTVYSLETDNLCTIISGTSNYGRAVLWDTRMTNFVQMYFMNTCKGGGRSSPVYSLSFDSSKLFAATDVCLNCLDFSVSTGAFKNYNIRYLTFQLNQM